MLSSGMQCYDMELMLSSGLELMLSSGLELMLLSGDEMLSSGKKCYHMGRIVIIWS